MAAAPEADVSDRPGRPEAPPRSIARRPALTGARRPARGGGDRGGLAEPLRAGERFAVGAVGCWEPRPRLPTLSGTAPPRLNGRRRAPHRHGNGLFVARTPAQGLPGGAC